MKIITKLNLTNLRENRARTIVTIIGIALSVALILAVVGIVTSILHTERISAINKYGDFHIMYRDIPGDKVSVLEESNNFRVVYCSNHIEYVTLEDGTRDYHVYGPYPRSSYEPITDSSKLIRDSQHQYNVFLKYKDTSKYELSEKQLKNALRDAGYEGNIDTRDNDTVAVLDGKMSEVARVLIVSFATLALGVMAIVAAFVIRNSFNISITERVRQFGMLASVGARPRQIRHMVLQEGAIIGLVAIPLGLLLGTGATGAVVALINNLISSMFEVDNLFYIPYQAYLLIILIGMFIVFLSAASPAIVASRVSPISALRNVQDIKLKAKKVRTPKFTQKIWGIGGVIAHKNLKRSRKKYRATVVSIVVSVVVFISVFTFMSYGQKIVNLFFDDTGANYIIGGGSEELYLDVAQRFNLKEYGYYSAAQQEVENSNTESPVAPTYLRVVSRAEFERYAKRLGYHGDDARNLAVLHDSYFSYTESGSFDYHRGTSYKVGDKIKLTIVRTAIPQRYDDDIDLDNLVEEDVEKVLPDGDDYEVNTIREDIEFELTHITEESPLGEPNHTYFGNGTLYVSEDNPQLADYKEFLVAYNMYIKDSGRGDDITEYLEQESTHEKYSNNSYDYSDVEKAMQVIRNTILLGEILTYGFIVVVSMIGITNIFNTITTNIALRAKEFAVLKSIGMTQKEFNHMIRLESILYTTRALLIGLPIGLLVSYGVSKLFDEASLGFGWLIPWPAIAISIVTVALLVAAIMRYSTRQIRKQNIIETIRKESF